MILIDKEGPIDKVILIDKEGPIHIVIRIDKEGAIDREISIGPVRNLVIKVPPE